jgi:Domain of unknown function (DUF4338)
LRDNHQRLSKKRSKIDLAFYLIPRYLLRMDTALRFRGRDFHPDQVDFVRQLIAKTPNASRRSLSIEVCQAWAWTQPNGTPCDALCRSFLLQLHRAGQIELPAARWVGKQPRRHAVIPFVDLDPTPLAVPFSQIGPLQIRQVRRTPEEALVKSLVAQHHYLGYVHPVGEHLKYLITAADQPIACLCWSSAPRHLGPRDRYIGWSKESRKANIRFVAYQSRFLILPWVKVPHLASHILGAISRRLSDDWQQLYAHPIYFTETFVDAPRYPGTCYRAANWVFMGMTTGRGKADSTHKTNRSLKQVLGYPLTKHFRRLLCADGPQG